MLNFIKNVLPPSTTKFLFTMSKWIGALLLSAIVSTFVITRLINSFIGPGAYFVYLVGDFSDANLQKLKQAFENERKANLRIADVDIHFVSLDAKEKDAEKISAKLAMKNDTLFVIGHLSTTASANALPNYLNADPPIPVILPNETNPELLPPDFRINYLPVFRLSPTDNKQAEKAADFIVDQGAENIWVVQDVVINPVYSAYLAQEFISQIHEKNQLREARQIYESQLQIYESQLNEGRQYHASIFDTSDAGQRFQQRRL